MYQTGTVTWNRCKRWMRRHGPYISKKSRDSWLCSTQLFACFVAVGLNHPVLWVTRGITIISWFYAQLNLWPDSQLSRTGVIRTDPAWQSDFQCMCFGSEREASSFFNAHRPDLSAWINHQENIFIIWYWWLWQTLYLSALWYPLQIKEIIT